MFNLERTAGLCDFSPDTHPIRVFFWQGYRVIGVTGTKAMAAECITDQKVRIQSTCFPKLQKTFVSLFGALVLPEPLPCNPLITFFPSPGTTGRVGYLGGVFPNSRLLKDVKTVKTNLFTYQAPMMPYRGFSSAEFQPHPSLALLVLQIFVRRCCGTSLKVLYEDVVALPTTYSTTSLVLNHRAWLQPGSSEGSTRSTMPNLDISVVRNVGASCLFLYTPV